MLETLISSRIRRTLVEYILTHPSDRFYLRGLAKSLNLAVSPLRRELKRLEQAGVLRPDHEGNMLFYTVETGSPLFVQLQQAAASAASATVSVAPSDAPAPAVASTPLVAAAPAAAVVREPSPARASVWSGPMSTPVLIGAASVGTGLVLLIAGLAYLGLTQREFVTKTSSALIAKPAEVTVVVPPTSASGTMRGSRYQVVPGGFGGFSSGGRNESY